MKVVLVQLEQINCLFLKNCCSLKKKNNLRKKKASAFNTEDKIKEENLNHEEEFKKFHKKLFEKMLKELMDFAVGLLTEQKK